MGIVLLTAILAAIISLLVSHILTTRRLAVIHDLVNSNLTRVQADLEIAQRRIEILEAQVVQK